MDSRKSVTLNELICELAYGRRMNYADMVDYERDNNCVPADSKRRGWLELGSRDLSGGINVYAGGVTYVDPEYDERADERRYEALRSPVYCDARDFIFGHAEAGTICIHARSPREDRRDGDSAPIATNYRPIPKEAFMTEHLFAPDDPPILWPKEGCLAQDAEWFFPRVEARDVAKIVSLWRERSLANEVDLETKAPGETAGDAVQPFSAQIRNAAEVYQERVKRLCSQGVERSSLKDDWESMQKDFQNITRERVRGLRRLYAPASWKNPGRK